MQQAFAEWNADADEPVRVRIGLHTGEAIREADDFFGTHVNLAARVGGAARGGEILVSPVVRALVEGSDGLRLDRGRQVRMKGFDAPQHVHRVLWDPDDEPAPLPDSLTAREGEVLSHIASGETNAEIAEALVISPATVTRHVSNILTKTDLSNRTELARYATEQGLTD
jgi:DNA-binding NarL/FixJ family response regulator